GLGAPCDRDHRCARCPRTHRRDRGGGCAASIPCQGRCRALPVDLRDGDPAPQARLVGGGPHRSYGDLSMPFVKRDPSGRVVAVSEQETADIREWIEADAPSLADYVRTLAPRPPAQTRQALEHSDLGLIRVIEDLIDTLLAKDVIR